MKSLTCIVCPNGCSLTVGKQGDQWQVDGNLCPKGRDFAIGEMEHPMRTVCTTVRTTLPGLPRLPVHTDREIPLSKVLQAMNEIKCVTLDHPVHTGDIVIRQICGTCTNIIASSDTDERME